MTLIPGGDDLGKPLCHKGLRGYLCMGAGACMVTGMATKRSKTVGGGRVVTPAPKRAKGKSTPKATKAGIVAHLATARQANLARGAKGNYTDKGAEILAGACARAMTLPSLTEAGVSTGKARTEAQARRAHARKVRATLVDCADVLAPNKEGEISHDRPENTVRARIAGIARAMGLPADTFYAVRAEAYAEGETPRVYIVRK